MGSFRHGTRVAMECGLVAEHRLQLGRVHRRNRGGIEVVDTQPAHEQERRAEGPTSRRAEAIVGADALLIGAGPAWASPAAYPTPGTRSAVCDTSSAIIRVPKKTRVTNLTGIPTPAGSSGR